MNELVLLFLAIAFACSAFYGGVYLIRNPQFDVEWYIRERIREYIESRTPDEIPDIPRDSHSSSQFDSSTPSILPSDAQSVSSEKVVQFSELFSPNPDPFNPFLVSREGQSLCNFFFPNCKPVKPTMANNPLDKYLNERVPQFIPAESSSTRLWAGLFWNQWQWAYERWTTLQNVAELLPVEDTYDKFLSHVFSLPSDVGPKQSNDFLTIREEQFLWDFLNGVRADPPSCRYYRVNYSGLEKLAKTEADTDWKSWLIYEKNLPDNYTNIEVPPMLTYLYPGCSIQAQYSEYHTVRVQMKGSARYLIISPQQLSKMHLFPYAHANNRQSQINWFGDAAKLGDYDDIKNIEVAYVVLEPADVLIIPPGWMVHVEAHNTSMYLDIQSPSLEQIKFLEAMSTRLPFPGSLSRDEKIVYAQVYLVHVLSRIHGLTSIRGYATKLYNARYALMFPENSLFMQQHSFSCFADNTEFHQSVLEKMEKVRMQEFADFVSKRFNDVKIAQPLRWLWLGNYVDSILRWAYGANSYGEAAVFLKNCLTMEGKIEVFEEVEGPSVMRIDSSTGDEL